MTEKMTTREYLQKLANLGYTVIDPEIMRIQDVLAIYKQLDSLTDALRDANEGAKLMYSLSTGDDVTKLLNDWQLNANAEEAVNHQDDLLPCGHSSEQLGGFGGCNPNGSCMICESQKKDEGSKTINLGGYKATATASWRERHLNEGG